MEQTSKRKKMNIKLKKNEIDTNTIFPLLLATLCNKGNETTSQSLVRKCLKTLHSSLFSKSLNPSISLQPILSLLPNLLSSKYPEIASLSAEIVGAASLLSLEMNERIALDGEIVKCLIWLVGCSCKKVSLAACNTVLDLSTTSIGRKQLLEFSALQKLVIGFLQVPISSTLINLCSEDKRSVTCFRIAFKEDRKVVALLHAAISLINSFNVEQIEKLPRNLSEAFLVFLKKLWAKVHFQLLLSNPPLVSIPKRQLCISNITINSLAESIFRLSTCINQFSPLPSLLVKRRFFGWSEDSYENFILHHWEASPFILKRSSRSLIEKDDIFSSFAEFLNVTEPSCTFLCPMLQNFISCPPISSDELDILNFLGEVKNELGSPIIYQQDIRVLRTENQSRREIHFFQESFDPHIMAPHIFSISDFKKCEEALKESYTVALRGMEFRFVNIAAVADTLASLFGQPSVGANIYLTPPNSQGLARHYDDHCVFVYQLFGSKQWTVFSQPNLQLPRLYGTLDRQNCADSESSLSDCKKFILNEGDVLYIPRGFSHEASTGDSGSGELSRFSLHITYGIEVEAPFEWTGFAHVVLYHWNRTKRQLDHALVKPFSATLMDFTVQLLHAMIELIAASDTNFRKACLVGALTLPPDGEDWLYANQKAVFNYLMNKIRMESRFLETLKILEVVVRNEDCKWLNLLQLLNKEKETVQEHDWNTIPEMKRLYTICVQQQDLAEPEFVLIKTRFCEEAAFEDAIDSYRIVLEKYKKTRNQYLNGMLSLHCN